MRDGVCDSDCSNYYQGVRLWRNLHTCYCHLSCSQSRKESSTLLCISLASLYWNLKRCMLLVFIKAVIIIILAESVHRHMHHYEVEYLQFAFRWMNNLLMRELPLRCTIRLWDTYQVQKHRAKPLLLCFFLCIFVISFLSVWHCVGIFSDNNIYYCFTSPAHQSVST